MDFAKGRKKTLKPKRRARQVAWISLMGSTRSIYLFARRGFAELTNLLTKHKSLDVIQCKKLWLRRDLAGVVLDALGSSEYSDGGLKGVANAKSPLVRLRSGVLTLALLQHRRTSKGRTTSTVLAASSAEIVDLRRESQTLKPKSFARLVSRP